MKIHILFGTYKITSNKESRNYLVVYRNQDMVVIVPKIINNIKATVYKVAFVNMIEE